MIRSMNVKNWTLDDCAVLEAAARALARVRAAEPFDPEIFEAIAQAELRRLREEIAHERHHR
jgi:hypothetical protein